MFRGSTLSYMLQLSSLSAMVSGELSALGRAIPVVIAQNVIGESKGLRGEPQAPLVCSCSLTSSSSGT